MNSSTRSWPYSIPPDALLQAARARLCKAKFRPFLAAAFPTLEKNPQIKFEDSFYFGAVAEHAEAFLSGQLRRLVVTLPTGTYKSRVWSVSTVAWEWVHNPFTRFLVGTNDGKLGWELSDLTRDLVKSEWFRTLFNPDWVIRPDVDAKNLFANNFGGQRQMVSTGSPVVGKKAHRLILDDVHDADSVFSSTVRASDKAWFRNSFWDRQVNFKTSCIVVVNHRTHPQDLASELIHEGWDELRLVERMEERYRKTFPLGGTDPRNEGEYLRPSRFGPAEEAAVKAISNLAWTAKHQQNPEVSEGTMFPSAKVKTIPHAPAGTRFVRAWDTAASDTETASNTSGVAVGRTPTGRTVIMDVRRGRWLYGERNEQMLDCARQDSFRSGVDNLGIWIENPGGSGGKVDAGYMVRELAGYTVNIATVSGKGNKVKKAGPLSSQWCAGNVDIVKGDWNKAYLERMEAFPGTHDKDDTDASAIGFNELAVLLGNVDQVEGLDVVVNDVSEIDRLGDGTFSADAYTHPNDMEW